jgi:small subunit ribosomal protein S8e
MGISRDSHHKRRKTGGRENQWRKKRKFELGRAAANTRLGAKRVRSVRCRGGNIKWRALRLDTGNFSWGSEVCTRKTRILTVTYNATNNELVRTNALVKNCVVQIDATPFRQWYEQHYGVNLQKKKAGATKEEDAKQSAHLKRTIKSRQAKRNLDALLEEQFNAGRLYACLSSRPGQSGRADGYILEGQELQFYLKKMQKKKGKSGGN